MTDRTTLDALICPTGAATVEWQAKDPVLALRQEAIEFCADGSVRVKYGDGTKKWSELPYAGIRKLDELDEDSSHRTVTDAQIAAWNGKQDALTFDSAPTAGSTKPVTSGGVATAVQGVRSAIPSKVSQLTNDGDGSSGSKYATEAFVGSKVASVYKYKGTVDTYAELPASGVAVGDTWNVVEDHGGAHPGTNWAWTGSAWDPLGGTIDVSIFVKASELAAVAKSGSYTDLTNKPTIPTTLAALAADATHRTVTDAEKTTWNAKQNALTFDTAPTAGSTKPVTSGGVKTALDTVSGNIPKASTSLSDSGDLLRKTDKLILDGGTV